MNFDFMAMETKYLILTAFRRFQIEVKIFHLPRVVFEIFNVEEGRTRKMQKII